MTATYANRQAAHAPHRPLKGAFRVLRAVPMSDGMPFDIGAVVHAGELGHCDIGFLVRNGSVEPVVPSGVVQLYGEEPTAAEWAEEVGRLQQIVESQQELLDRQQDQITALQARHGVSDKAEMNPTAAKIKAAPTKVAIAPPPETRVRFGNSAPAIVAAANEPADIIAAANGMVGAKPPAPANDAADLRQQIAELRQLILSQSAAK